MNKRILSDKVKVLAIKAGFDPTAITIEKTYVNFDLEEFARNIIQTQHLVWHTLYTGNDVLGYVDMKDYPKAVAKRFGYK